MHLKFNTIVFIYKWSTNNKHIIIYIYQLKFLLPNEIVSHYLITVNNVLHNIDLRIYHDNTSEEGGISLVGCVVFVTGVSIPTCQRGLRVDVLGGKPRNLL